MSFKAELLSWDFRSFSDAQDRSKPKHPMHDSRSVSCYSVPRFDRALVNPSRQQPHFT